MRKGQKVSKYECSRKTYMIAVESEGGYSNTGLMPDMDQALGTANGRPENLTLDHWRAAYYYYSTLYETRENAPMLFLVQQDHRTILEDTVLISPVLKD